MMSTISILNDDCLHEVFAWLTLKEKCGVERVGRSWQRVVRDMLVGEERLELCYPYKPDNLADYKNAYFSEELNEFFRTAVLNDEVVALFHRFNSGTPTCVNKLQIVVESIRHLTINQTFVLDSRLMGCDFKVLKLKAAAFEKLMSIFPNVTSLEFVDNDTKDCDEWAWFFYSKTVLNKSNYTSTVLVMNALAFTRRIPYDIIEVRRRS